MGHFTYAAILIAVTSQSPDPVRAHIYEHFDAGSPVIVVVGESDFPASFWKRVKHLVAFRIHRPVTGGTTQVDAPIYLVRDSALYFKAAAALRSGTTIHEYVWCLLAAVIAHEAAHSGPMTEREALTAEAAQLRRCLFAGHLHSTDGWSASEYLQKVEAKLRNPREHY